MTTTSEIGKTTYATVSDREFAIMRSFEAPRALIWDAFTKPEHMRRWLLGPGDWEMTVCDVDLRPGGGWRMAWRKADGETMELSGEYQVVQAPERLVNTERWGEPWPETLNTVEFVEEDGITTVTTTILYPSSEARDAAVSSGMKEGVNLSYNRLARLLSSLA
jgi:uncharacterized protein YndB with AHSA1/START domain